jgi:hypothetical protein
MIQAQEPVSEGAVSVTQSLQVVKPPIYRIALRGFPRKFREFFRQFSTPALLAEWHLKTSSETKPLILWRRQ